jgi:hypothetical protein
MERNQHIVCRFAPLQQALAGRQVELPLDLLAGFAVTGKALGLENTAHLQREQSFPLLQIGQPRIRSKRK